MYHRLEVSYYDYRALIHGWRLIIAQNSQDQKGAPNQNSGFISKVLVSAS
jgi:hypothetical protein